MIFSIEDITVLGEYFVKLFSFNNFINKDFFFYLSNYGVILLIGIIFSLPVGSYIEKIGMKNNVTKLIFGLIYILLFVISISYLVSDTYNPFMYFRFYLDLPIFEQKI